MFTVQFSNSVTMLISVKILKGEECTIEVSASTSIISVKQLVAQQLQIPVHQQKLVFKGKTLSDSQCLCDYNIVDGNKLHLFISKGAQSASSSIFWDQLLKFLEKHFTPSDAMKVLEEFKKNQASKMASLSLDDLERLAALNMDSDASAKTLTSRSQHVPEKLGV